VTDRRIAFTAGLLFILATLAAIGAAALVPDLSHSDYLLNVADHDVRLAVAALLYLIAAGTSAGISIALYPLVRTVGAVTALGSVVARSIEATLYSVAVVCLLGLAPLAQDYAGAAVETRGPLQAMADTVLSLRDNASLAGVVAFVVGATMYYVLLYRSQLVPRWLSVWGLVGTTLIMSACVLALFSGNPVTSYAPLILPIGVQEMVLAAWLLVKGFRSLPVSARVVA